MKALFGVILILHGLVHLLYFGHSQRYFELKPGMTWPDDARVFRAMQPEIVRKMAGALCIITAVIFVFAGIMLFSSVPAWKLTTVIASILSSLIYLFFWNGKPNNLDGQGGVGVLINLLILVVLQFFF